MSHKGLITCVLSNVTQRANQLHTIKMAYKGPTTCILLNVTQRANHLRTIKCHTKGQTLCIINTWKLAINRRNYQLTNLWNLVESLTQTSSLRPITSFHTFCTSAVTSQLTPSPFAFSRGALRRSHREVRPTPDAAPAAQLLRCSATWRTIKNSANRNRHCTEKCWT